MIFTRSRSAKMFVVVSAADPRTLYHGYPDAVHSHVLAPHTASKASEMVTSKPAIDYVEFLALAVLGGTIADAI
jgi:hypothetical protein